MRAIYDIRIKTDDGTILGFPFVSNVEITRSWQELTGTAKIVLPRKIKALKAGQLNKLIRPGNEVSIRLGYDVTFAEEFFGFVTSVGSKAPVEIECEDLMWKLKQTVVNKSYRTVRLAQLIRDIVPPGIECNVIDTELGSFRISRASVAKVLEELKQTYVLQSYIRGKTLCVGFAYPPDWAGQAQYLAKYHFQKTVIADDLKFKDKADVRLKVKAVSMLPNNKRLTVEVGDDSGEERTLHFYNISSEQELKKRATAEMERLRYDGYRGSFTTYGFPYVDHGYTVELKDTQYPERAGRYLVDKVVTSSGNGGYRREITIGAKTTTNV